MKSLSKEMGEIVRKVKIRGQGKLSSRCLRHNIPAFLPRDQVLAAHNSNKTLHPKVTVCEAGLPHQPC